MKTKKIEAGDTFEFRGIRLTVGDHILFSLTLKHFGYSSVCAEGCFLYIDGEDNLHVYCPSLINLNPEGKFNKNEFSEITIIKKDINILENYLPSGFKYGKIVTFCDGDETVSCQMIGFFRGNIIGWNGYKEELFINNSGWRV